MVGPGPRRWTDDAIRHWKAKGLDLTPMLTPAQPPPIVNRTSAYCQQIPQDHGLDLALDKKLIELADPR
jgi:glutamate synthase (NADPH/NADH) large chain